MLGAHHRAPSVYDLDRVGAPLPAATVTLLVAELPWIKAAYARYGDRVRFLGIDILEDRATAAALAQRAALPFPVANVDAATMDAIIDLDARQYGGMKYRIPADFTIDANGIVRGAWHGLPVDTVGNPIDVIPQHLAGFLGL